MLRHLLGRVRKRRGRLLRRLLELLWCPEAARHLKLLMRQPVLL